IRFLVIRTISNFFILLTVFGVVFTFGPAVYFEAEYRVGQAFGVSYVLPSESNEKGSSGFRELIEERERRRGGASNAFSAIIDGEREQIIVPKSSEFSVVIPKIGANENVIENVDPSNEDEYLRALMKG